jgi:hypothetical protein
MLKAGKKAGSGASKYLSKLLAEGGISIAFICLFGGSRGIQAPETIPGATGL